MKAFNDEMIIQNTVYRNLKLENVLFDEKYYPQITNFGLAIKFEEGKEQALSVGTPLNMAPEVVNDEHYSNKIDAFSYGMIVYYLLTIRKTWIDKKDINAFSFPKLVMKLIKDNHHDFFDSIYINEEELDDYMESVSTNLKF